METLYIVDYKPAVEACFITITFDFAGSETIHGHLTLHTRSISTAFDTFNIGSCEANAFATGISIAINVCTTIAIAIDNYSWDIISGGITIGLERITIWCTSEDITHAAIKIFWAFKDFRFCNPLPPMCAHFGLIVVVRSAVLSCGTNIIVVGVDNR
jgi:hypothetical protein